MAVLLVFGLLAKAATADTPLEAAKAAVDASDYLTARTQLDAIVAAGASGPDELAEVYRLTGIVAGALGDAKAATDRVPEVPGAVAEGHAAGRHLAEDRQAVRRGAARSSRRTRR